MSFLMNQRTTKPAQHLALLLGSSEKHVVIPFRQQLLFSCNRRVGHNFEERACRHFNEAGELHTRGSRTTFCYIRRDCGGGPSHLIGQPKAFRVRKAFAEFINLLRKLNCVVPYIKLLKVEHSADRLPFGSLDPQLPTLREFSFKSLNTQPSTLN